MTIWIVRLIVVLFFLVMFVWRSRISWGVGLLSVSAVVLLDALSGRGLLDDIGFFGFFIGGLVLAGALFWANDMLRGDNVAAESNSNAAEIVPFRPNPRPTQAQSTDAGFDRQLIYEQIRENLGPDDVLDLIYDLEMYENDVVNLSHSMPRVITGIMDEAELQGKTGQLGLAVERILTPIAPANLPRLEKLSADSPPSLIRQYLIANYSINGINAIARDVGVDYEELGTNSKKSRVRELLLYLKRRNDLPNLFAAMEKQSMATQVNGRM